MKNNTKEKSKNKVVELKPHEKKFLKGIKEINQTIKKHGDNIQELFDEIKKYNKDTQKKGKEIDKVKKIEKWVIDVNNKMWICIRDFSNVIAKYPSIRNVLSIRGYGDYDGALEVTLLIVENYNTFIYMNKATESHLVNSVVYSVRNRLVDKIANTTPRVFPSDSQLDNIFSIVNNYPNENWAKELFIKSFKNSTSRKYGIPKDRIQIPESTEDIGKLYDLIMQIPVEIRKAVFCSYLDFSKRVNEITVEPIEDKTSDDYKNYMENIADSRIKADDIVFATEKKEIVSKAIDYLMRLNGESPVQSVVLISHILGVKPATMAKYLSQGSKEELKALRDLLHSFNSIYLAEDYDWRIPMKKKYTGQDVSKIVYTVRKRFKKEFRDYVECTNEILIRRETESNSFNMVS